MFFNCGKPWRDTWGAPLALWRVGYGGGGAYLAARQQGLADASVTHMEIRGKSPQGQPLAELFFLRSPRRTNLGTFEVLIFQRENDFTGTEKFKLVFAFGKKKLSHHNY